MPMLLGVIGIQLLITGSFVKVPYNEDLFTFYSLYLFLTKLNVRSFYNIKYALLVNHSHKISTRKYKYLYKNYHRNITDHTKQFLPNFTFLVCHWIHLASNFALEISREVF